MEEAVKSFSVLLVDDENDFLKLARDILGECPSFSVVGEARSGEEALRLLADLRPDVIVLDVQMRSMNGFQAARRLLNAAPGRPRRVVIVSAFHDPHYEVLARAVGASGFLSKKDFSAEAILRLVNDRAEG